jgi:hypothetical protein
VGLLISISEPSERAANAPLTKSADHTCSGTV